MVAADRGPALTSWPEESRRVEITASLGAGALATYRPDGSFGFPAGSFYAHAALGAGVLLDP